VGDVKGLKSNIIVCQLTYDFRILGYNKIKSLASTLYTYNLLVFRGLEWKNGRNAIFLSRYAYFYFLFLHYVYHQVFVEISI